LRAPSACCSCRTWIRDPIPRWSFSRVTLIGDAAHPMQPVGAQAGSQAIVDGRVLAASLLANADAVAALVRYQDQRIAAMNDMVIRNRKSRPGDGAADRGRARARRI
jgi:2-polyprenyl-6-methoxyphenol hydroxylase-like FAD-dependent oxidoreductase